ncbi:hypothetical protein EHE19_017015 [Ruminiclostridium herbifermentans]|uniref:Uncharacterized protein n=1 Tax=Ruminiclostridium herbifermentans TaxID=2488810 RepID=A0A4U7J7F4_9FIRM|nr:hypothetical protein [Ruminiclostridium herbifermentans]QNU66533.1 hypothetical protein EHE19_017015 [Ruminiclostridium herbifermentans]
MYTLEQTRKIKIIIIVFIVIFFILAVWGYLRGGHELISYGFMNEPLASIVMVASFFSSIILILVGLAINALQKDIEIELKIIDNQFLNKK